MSIKPLFAWYDLWVGAFWDRKSRKLYILPLPCIGVVIQYRPVMYDVIEEQPERFKKAVRAACCNVCGWPECGCEATAYVIRKAINAWNELPPMNQETK